MKDTERQIDTSSLERPVGPAVRLGWQRKCPNCGSGPMFDGYLTVRHDCPVCEQELYHHRADDGPAWATMVLTGHVLAPAMIIVYELFRPEPWVMAVGFSLGIVLLSLWFLPRIKGVFVAFQWAKRMHGFGSDGD
ncbi:DUF983 domain-containing protein [Roseobacter sp. HKCCA0434]|uniref:DUF983 domain-containing protein n=1 Tax=Roseobacter sp. HKCCA0434 TaxID=3079297 RepID=UPI002905DB25|nr:DUF983 domain-containing protein [Roseobacter sp. HKCCA0434]